MKKYSAQCDICKRTFEHEKQLVVNQQLGFHKRHEHGIDGASKDPEARRINAREAYWRKMGYSSKEIERRRQSYAEKQAAVAASPTQTPPSEPVKKQTKRDADPLPLTQCPCCGARFWVTRKDSE